MALLPKLWSLHGSDDGVEDDDDDEDGVGD